MAHVTNSDEIHFGPWHFGIPGVSKHVTMMLLASAIVAVAAIATARAALRAEGRGLLANMVEATCLFLRDQIVRPGIGEHHASRWFPLFATFFFFILANNLLGLLPTPLGVSATGNVWVTMSLALVTLAYSYTIGALIMWVYTRARRRPGEVTGGEPIQQGTGDPQVVSSSDTGL